jgi:hypothetical protein
LPEGHGALVDAEVVRLVGDVPAYGFRELLLRRAASDEIAPLEQALAQ